jgi:putative oxidoreductase
MGRLYTEAAACGSIAAAAPYRAESRHTLQEKPDMSQLESFGAAWAPRVRSLLRIFSGLLFLEHGLMKLVSFPAPLPGGMHAPMGSMIWFAGVIETVGGALVALGLLTRPAAFIMSGEMAFAYFMVHAQHGMYPSLNGGDAAILFCFVFLYLAAAGPGPWSVDAAMSGGRSHQPA